MPEIIRTFEDLDCWKISRELRLKIGELVKRLPKEEKFTLCDQLIRASRSVTNNIAEGYGRFHFQENIQYCRQARGSLFEIIDHLLICHEENYISKEELEILKAQTIRAISIINGYINYLKKAKNT